MTGARILYVEDDPEIGQMIRFLLTQADYQVTCAGTLADGIAFASTQKFDLFLLDNWLPDGTGIMLCHQIREFDAATPIIFLSAAAYEADRVQAHAAGAQAYIVKPTDGHVILETISHLLATP